MPNTNNNPPEPEYVITRPTIIEEGLDSNKFQDCKLENNDSCYNTNEARTRLLDEIKDYSNNYYRNRSDEIFSHCTNSLSWYVKKKEKEKRNRHQCCLPFAVLNDGGYDDDDETDSSCSEWSVLSDETREENEGSLKSTSKDEEEGDKKKECRRVVHFCENVVTEIRILPRISPEEHNLLYYTTHELQRIIDEYRRGLLCQRVARGTRMF